MTTIILVSQMLVEIFAGTTTSGHGKILDYNIIGL